MLQTQSFNIQIRPKPKQRPRFAGHAYTPKETSDYEKEIAWEIRAQGGEKVSGPISVEMVFYYKNPKNMKIPKRHTGRPDLDNLVKGVLDAANGVLWDDDSEVSSISADKWYAVEDAVFLSVTGVKT